VIFAALAEAAGRGELILVRDGLLRWHLRQDGVVVVREILVLPFRRGTGVGRALLAELAEKNPGRPLRARCPQAYESNGFWRRMGFVLADASNGVNVWESRP
jgi:GNAT superfamily N-acetyltransferase